MSIYRESKRGEEKEKEEDSSAKENCSIKFQKPEVCGFKSIKVGTDFFSFFFFLFSGKYKHAVDFNRSTERVGHDQDEFKQTQEIV